MVCYCPKENKRKENKIKSKWYVWNNDSVGLIYLFFLKFFFGKVCGAYLDLRVLAIATLFAHVRSY